MLTRGYRVPAEVIEFAARLLPHIAADVAAPEPVREHRGRLDVRRTEDLAAAVASDLAARREGTTGVIAADRQVPSLAAGLAARGMAIPTVGTGDDRHVLVPASLCKGLEFDHVVVAEPTEIVAGEASRLPGLRRLYVALTRAVSGLTVVHVDPLPTELVA